ncbi:MAG TPA: hypothetical protein VGM15_03140 [Burkholderiaceae bacterium]|jgi:hypothetical protein
MRQVFQSSKSRFFPLAEQIDFIKDCAVLLEASGQPPTKYLAVLASLERLAHAQQIVTEQTQGDLWFNARYVTEAFLQQELRRLHAAIA